MLARAGDTRCDQLRSRYGKAVVNCWDFSTAADTELHGLRGSGSTTHFDAERTASGTRGGSLRWIIKSFDQVKAENPGLPDAKVHAIALASGTGRWTRWLGRNFDRGETYYLQFKYRFSDSFRTPWGGAGPKVFILDHGIRRYNAKLIPPRGEMGMITNSSMDVVMTTTLWTQDPDTAHPVMYHGSTNFGGTESIVAPMGRGNFMIQPGLDTRGRWNGREWVEGCQFQGRSAKGCVTYGAPDTWHEITVKITIGTYRTRKLNQDPVFRHDGVLAVWYDGRNIWNMDPDAPPFRAGQPSKAECMARQVPVPNYNDCHTGIDFIRLDMDRIANGGDVDNAPLGPDDPGSSLSGLHLLPLSWRRIPRATNSLLESEAYRSHKEVRIWYDDVVVSTVAIPMMSPVIPRE
jgi:hypothetical protein